ncbi:MAG: hypothetical protein P8X65_12860 [Syntrophobacterales bacterium]
MWRSVPTGAPLPGGAGLGVHTAQIARRLFTVEEVCFNSDENELFQRELCYHTVKEVFGLGKEIFVDFRQAEKPKNRFSDRGAKVAA